MGNQCTPRSFQRPPSNPQNVTRQPPINQKNCSRQIHLAPQSTESDGAKTQTYTKSMGCQNGTELYRSLQSLKTKVKEIYQATDTNKSQTVKEQILQIMQMQSTLDDKKSSTKQQVEQKLDSSVLSKRNIKVNIETPSQVRDSLLSAWNKSNFHQSQLFNTLKYDELFMPVIDSRALSKK